MRRGISKPSVTCIIVQVPSDLLTMEYPGSAYSASVNGIGDFLDILFVGQCHER